MNPNQLRQVSIELGQLLSLFGDYNAPSTWSGGKWLQAKLISYIVVERHHHWKKYIDIDWDTAAIVSLEHSLQVTVEEGHYSGNRLLLIQRYPDSSWENDIIVHVFGIKSDEILSHTESLRLDFWHPKTVWLSAAAHLRLD